MKARAAISRRDFLATSAAAGAALVVGVRFDGEVVAQAPGPKPTPNPFDAWIRIASDGAVTLIVAKSEMGQGVFTALPMLLAEELDVDLASVAIEQAPTDAGVYNHGTGGSASIRTSFEPLRRAGATARTMLVAAAAERWGVEATACRTESATVLGPGGRRATYGELVADAAKRPLPAPESVALREPKSWSVIGTSVPRRDVPAKVDGSARFGLDVRVPGMLYAVVARCPVLGGRLKRFDPSKAKAVAGVRHVVELAPVLGDGVFARGGVAVVADSTWAAMRGRDALTVEWDEGAAASESSATIARQMEERIVGAAKKVAEEGDVAAALGKAARKLEASYEIPFQTHAAMEPLNATVHVRADGAEAWLGSQSPDWPQREIAKIAGVDPSKVVVHNTLLGGAFGRRYNADSPVEAAQVSKAVGAPVQLVWTREDDTRHGFYRPAALHRLAAGLDAGGRPVAWRHAMASPSIAKSWGWGPDPASSEVGGAVNLPYAIPARRMDFALVETAVPVMWWRSVEHSGNAFVVESFVDELAHAAGVDPLAFRLNLLAGSRKVTIPGEEGGTPLDTARLRGVLELAAAKAGWGSPLPAGRARGIAGHFSFDSYVAEVAEVSLEGGRPRVHRVVAAVDCGHVVHPDNLAAQVEGAIVYGLTATLESAITIDRGRVVQSNFHDYAMLRIDRMPVVEVHTVASAAAPTGIGEPGLPPIAPAVANALFALTGKRVRRLPIRPEDFA